MMVLAGWFLLADGSEAELESGSRGLSLRL